MIAFEEQKLIEAFGSGSIHPHPNPHPHMYAHPNAPNSYHNSTISSSSSSSSNNLYKSNFNSNSSNNNNNINNNNNNTNNINNNINYHSNINNNDNCNSNGNSNNNTLHQPDPWWYYETLAEDQESKQRVLRHPKYRNSRWDPSNRSNDINPISMPQTSLPQKSISIPLVRNALPVDMIVSISSSSSSSSSFPSSSSSSSSFPSSSSSSSASSTVRNSFILPQISVNNNNNNNNANILHSSSAASAFMSKGHEDNSNSNSCINNNNNNNSTSNSATTNDDNSQGSSIYASRERENIRPTLFVSNGRGGRDRGRGGDFLLAKRQYAYISRSAKLERLTTIISASNAPYVSPLRRALNSNINSSNSNNNNVNNEKMVNNIKQVNDITNEDFSKKDTNKILSVSREKTILEKGKRKRKSLFLNPDLRAETLLEISNTSKVSEY